VTRVRIERWAAVAPGVAGEADWRAWARAPVALRGEPDPDVGFLPAMQRRRCDALSRMMLAAANACCDDTTRAQALPVFASRHGSFGTTVTMLEALAVDEPLSPTSFSHSVHNTQAGLFSIWAGSQQAAWSLASRRETFEHGFLEAVCVLARANGRAVLFVCGDERLPEPVAALGDDPDTPHALALLLRSAEPGGAGDREALSFALEHAPGRAAPALAWPRALEFLRWWLGGEPELRLGTPPRSFAWRRVG
jgi:hypothetical protein